MGDGMDQSTARRRAREYGGVAVSARRSTGGRWHLGGWPDPKDVWIVVSVDRGAVLDDGDGLSVSVPDIDDDGRTALDRLVRRGGAGSAGDRLLSVERDGDGAAAAEVGGGDGEPSCGHRSGTRGPCEENQGRRHDMKPVKIDQLAKGDTFRFTDQTSECTVTRSEMFAKNANIWRVDFKGPGALDHVQATPDMEVLATRMIREVEVTCLAWSHGSEKVRALHDFASGPHPRGILCGSCDERTTAEVIKRMQNPEPKRGDQVITEEYGVCRISGFNTHDGVHKARIRQDPNVEKWVPESELERDEETGAWRWVPAQREVD